MTSGLMHEISAQPNRTARSPEELFPLLDYCRAGRLKEVGEWINAGHPINPPPNIRRSRRRSPLEVAIEKGFFALAELLLDGGATADGAILECAVQQHRVDIAELLIQRGVAPDAIWHGLIYDGGPEMIRLFVAHGFDPTSDFAYHRALCDHVQPHLALLKDHKERFPDLQRQAETALAHYCREGDLRAVSLLCWAGARPDAPVSYRLEDDGPENHTTPLEEAVGAGHLPILKRLKPRDYPDVLNRLMDALPSQPSEQMVDYLLELGAPLNTKPDGGSRLLEDLIRRLDERYPLPFPGRAERTLQLIAHVTERGARWMPDPENDIRYYRRRVRTIKAEHLIQLFRILKVSGAATVEFMDAILASPSLKKHLGTHLETTRHILHPLVPKPAPQSRSEITSLPPAPRPTAAELTSRAKGVILETVRHKLVAHFTERTVRCSVYAHSARRGLGLPRMEEELIPIFTKAVERLNEKARGFTIEFDSGSWSHGSHHFSVSLKADAEWPDVAREVWHGIANPNPHLLGNPSLRLLQLIRSGEFASGFTGEQEIATRARLGADRHGLSRYLWEIRGKTRAALYWKSTGGERYGEQRSYRLWIDAEHEIGKDPEGLNPEFAIRFDEFTRTDLDSARQRIHEMVVHADSGGDEPLFIFHITTYRQLAACFRGSDRVTGRGLANFFDALKFNDALVCRYHFGEHSDRWFLTLEPVQDWATSLAAVRDELAQPTLEAKFGISSEAAKLLSWIQSLRPEEMLGCYSPIVENARKRGIGIASPWGDENFPAYIQMLVDEINQNTDYDLRLQPWKEYSSTRTRLRVARRVSDLDEIFKQLRLIAFQRGVAFEGSSSRRLLETVVSGQVASRD